MSIKRFALAVLALALIAIPLGAALAKEIGHVTISGPGLKEPIVIDDFDVANRLGPGQLDNFESQVIDPEVDPEAPHYTIDRGYVDDKGNIFTTDHLRYYPETKTGRGLIYYVGMDGGNSDMAGNWYLTKSTGEDFLKEILAGNGVVLAGAKSMSADTARSGAQPEVAEVAVEPAKADTAQEAAPSVAAQEPVAAPPLNLPLVIGGALLLVIIAFGAGMTVGRARGSRVQG